MLQVLPVSGYIFIEFLNGIEKGFLGLGLKMSLVLPLFDMVKEHQQPPYTSIFFILLVIVTLKS